MTEVIYWIASLWVLVEAMNKIERVSNGVQGVLKASWRDQAEMLVAILAWGCLCLGAAAAVSKPILTLPWPLLGDMFIMLGTALLLVRTRFCKWLFHQFGEDRRT